MKFFCYALKSIAIAAFSLLSISVSASSNKPDNKPNILFFLVDDLGWSDTGCQGSDFYETPYVDNLANEGARFTNAYVSHPRCVPSRYSIITGRYPARAKMPGPGEGKLKPGTQGRIKPDEYNIAQALK
jgi:arylsulfatase A-like enzyme